MSRFMDLLYSSGFRPDFGHHLPPSLIPYSWTFCACFGVSRYCIYEFLISVHTRCSIGAQEFGDHGLRCPTFFDTLSATWGNGYGLSYHICLCYMFIIVFLHSLGFRDSTAHQKYRGKSFFLLRMSSCFPFSTTTRT